jgi:hypothetical protein
MVLEKLVTCVCVCVCVCVCGVCVSKTKPIPFSLILYKNQLNMDQRSYCNDLKLLQESIGEILENISIVKIIFSIGL